MAQELEARLELIENSFAICRQEIDTKCDELHSRIETFRKELISELEQKYLFAKEEISQKIKKIANIKEIERSVSEFLTLESLALEVSTAVKNRKSKLIESQPCMLVLNWDISNSQNLYFSATINTTTVPYYKLKNRPIKSFVPFNTTLHMVPEKIAINSENNFISVTDSEQKSVHIFEPQGQFVTSINHSSLHGPYGIFFSKDKLYVTDIKTDFAFIFSVNGKLIKRFGGKGSTPHKLDFPTAIAVSWNGKEDQIYICDTNNNGVSIFNTNGACVRRLAYKQLVSPIDIKIYDNFIYVLHHSEMCVCVFDRRGVIVNKLVTHGLTGINVPKGFDIDRDENLYIIDGSIDGVKVFDKKGNCVHSLDNAGEFMECVGVAETAGDVYVLSRQGVNAVHKY